VNLGQGANRGEIFRGRSNDLLEFRLGFLQFAQFEQRASERDARGQVGRMALQADAAGLDRFAEESRPPVFVREGRERDRRRVLLDPALQFFYPPVVRHADNSTITGSL
jgi:hypothetical protein